MAKDLVTQKEIKDTGSVKLFNKLKGVEKRFVSHWLESKNAAEAYRHATKNPSMGDCASSIGLRMMKRPDVKAFLDEFMDLRTPAYYKVIDTYMGMMDATKANFVQNPEDKTWENTGDIEDWKARKDGADGITKLYGMNEEKGTTNVQINAESISTNFTQQFNTFLESKGEKPVEIKEESESVQFKEVSKYADDFKKFSSKS